MSIPGEKRNCIPSRWRLSLRRSMLEARDVNTKEAAWKGRAWKGDLGLLRVF